MSVIFVLDLLFISVNWSVSHLLLYNQNEKMIVLSYTYTVLRKKHPLTFSFIFHEWCVDLSKNCSEYSTQGKVDSDTVDTRYSLRPMT